MSESYDAVQAALPDINASRRAKEIMSGWERSLEIRPKGEPPFYLRIADGAMALEQTSSKQADFVVECTPGAFSDILHRRRDITHAIAEGQLELERGKYSELVSFDRIVGSAQSGKKGQRK